MARGGIWRTRLSRRRLARVLAQVRVAVKGETEGSDLEWS